MPPGPDAPTWTIPHPAGGEGRGGGGSHPLGSPPRGNFPRQARLQYLLDYLQYLVYTSLQLRRAREKLLMSDPVLATLTAARALLTPPGSWCQGSARDVVGSRVVARCSFAAISFAAISVALSSEAELAIFDVLATFGAIGEVAEFSSVVGWNDYPGRTHADVLTAFDQAIARRRASS